MEIDSDSDPKILEWSREFMMSWNSLKYSGDHRHTATFYKYLGFGPGKDQSFQPKHIFTSAPSNQKPGRPKKNLLRSWPSKSP